MKRGSIRSFQSAERDGSNRRKAKRPHKRYGPQQLSSGYTVKLSGRLWVKSWPVPCTVGRMEGTATTWERVDAPQRAPTVRKVGPRRSDGTRRTGPSKGRAVRLVRPVR
jgi:hypothetical protein